MATTRNYKSEYKNYHSSDKQKKNRAARNAARAEMVKKGASGVSFFRDMSVGPPCAVL